MSLAPALPLGTAGVKRAWASLAQRNAPPAKDLGPLTPPPYPLTLPLHPQSHQAKNKGPVIKPGRTKRESYAPLTSS